MTAPVLPVFLVHYDAPDWCASAVASVVATHALHTVVTVIDNGGRALPEDIDANVVSVGSNLGYTGGANRALAVWRDHYADSPLAVIASHDLHVEPDCLRRLRDAIENDVQLGAVGPVLTAAPRSTGGVWRRWHRGQSYDASIARADAPVRRDWLSGTCLMLRRAAVDHVGGFDGRFGSYMEDVDYCLRLADAGWSAAVVPGAHAHGLGSVSDRSQELIARNRLRLMEKREGRRGLRRGLIEAAAAVPALVAKGSVAAIRGRRTRHYAEAMTLLRLLVDPTVRDGTVR